MLQMQLEAGCLGGRQVLSPLQVAVAPGELVALVGPNGAGKSSLIRLLAGEPTIWRQSRGAWRWQQRLLTDCDALALARQRSWLPQQTALPAELTVGEVLQLAAWSWPQRPARAWWQAVAERWELDRLWSRPAVALSGGEAQRVRLARSWAQLQQSAGAPRVWLLDEPLAGLDVRHQQLLMRELTSLQADGVAVVLAAHELALALHIASRCWLLAGGALLADVAAAELSPDLLAQAFGVNFIRWQHPANGVTLLAPEYPID